MKTLGILINPNKEEAQTLAESIEKWALEKGIKVYKSAGAENIDWMDQVELVVCLGGDGTMLSLAPKMKSKSVPVIGINLGRLGFLTEVKKEEIFGELEKFQKEQSEIDDRVMIDAELQLEGASKQEHLLALNDIVISREGLSRLVTLDVFISGDKLTTFRGDGVIISTPTGSTAYTLSAGGAVVHPKLSCFVITPICPHAASLRPMVISSDEEVLVRLRRDPSGKKALLTADGQGNVEMNGGDEVVIRQSKLPFKIVKSSQRNYFEMLRENFQFPDHTV